MSMVKTGPIGIEPINREPINREPIYPEAVRPGDKVCIIDPANAFTQGGIDAATAYFTGKSLDVTISEDMAFRHGAPKERAERLNRVIRNPEYKGIFCMWGGYGTMSLLDLIDYEALRENRPVFTGFSDITAMHLAIAQRTGLVTFHGPALHSERRPTTLEAMEDFWEMLTHPNAAKVFRNLNGEPIQTLRAGCFEGQVTGGNLTLVSRLMGTPYEMDTRGKIVFLEEVGEKPYRLHGMLTQLKMAGKFRDAAGIIIGALTDCDTVGRPGSAMALVEDALADVEIPVVCNLRAGHICDPLTIPLNAVLRVEEGRIWKL